MKMVYICSPLHGDIAANMKKATEYCAFAAGQGVIPLAPHTIFTQYLDDNIAVQREQGLKMGIELLRRCDEIWVCGKVISPGMQNEIRYAAAHGIPVQYFPELDARRNTLSEKLAVAKRISAFRADNETRTAVKQQAVAPDI